MRNESGSQVDGGSSPGQVAVTPPVASPGAVPPPPLAPPPLAPPYPLYPTAAVPQAAPTAPRPRPVSVVLAVTLTFSGIVLAFLGVLLGYLANADVVSPAGQANAAMMSSAIGALLAAGFNLMAGSGAAVCAVFAMRGSNGARITLCVLTGVFAAWKLACGGIGLLGLSLMNNSAAPPPGYSIGLGYAASAIDLVLMLLAIGILVLLLIGTSHRYFSPPTQPRYF
ncbi:MAG: hypothetical protein ACRDUA_17260 [Micromonosporaceae bacterium]